MSDNRDYTGHTFFISGSRSIYQLPQWLKDALVKILHLGTKVIVGDCYGVDTAVQALLHSIGHTNVEVWHVRGEPRNNVGKFPTVKIHGNSQVAKDIAMTHACTVGIAIWDGDSNGTRHNVYRLNQQKKECWLVGMSLSTPRSAV